MAGKYYIKLFHVILDDPKMGTLGDRLWRRTIELFLMAGELDEDGWLPDIGEMSWRLRTDIATMKQELQELKKHEIVTHKKDRWFVVNFSKRQAAMSKKDLMRKKRKRDIKDHYQGEDVLPSGYQSVTSGNTDKIRLDKIRVGGDRNPTDNDDTISDDTILVDGIAVPRQSGFQIELEELGKEWVLLPKLSEGLTSDEREQIREVIFTAVNSGRVGRSQYHHDGGTKEDKLRKAIAYCNIRLVKPQVLTKCFVDNDGYWYTDSWGSKDGKGPHPKNIVTQLDEAVEWYNGRFVISR